MSAFAAISIVEVLGIVGFTLRLIPLWREKSHLRGRVYMHRRGALTWRLVGWMNVLLLVGGLLQCALGAFSWGTLAVAVVFNGGLIYYARFQRQLQLAQARYYEEREVGRVVVPDSPEGLS